ncbi:hypothetical protein [uncultured Nostoc sp.]|uniref:hypothetical protein n=1 Tax=uncultured Nostoc sp. TaxID=340711 RepID=UPI0035CA4FB7
MAVFLVNQKSSFKLKRCHISAIMEKYLRPKLDSETLKAMVNYSVQTPSLIPLV